MPRTRASRLWQLAKAPWQRHQRPWRCWSFACSSRSFSSAVVRGLPAMTSDKPSSPGDQWQAHEDGLRSQTYNKARAKIECFAERHSGVRRLDWCFARRLDSRIRRCARRCSPRASRSWLEGWVLLSVGRSFRWMCHIDNCRRALGWWWENVRWTEKSQLRAIFTSHLLGDKKCGLSGWMSKLLYLERSRKHLGELPHCVKKLDKGGRDLIGVGVEVPTAILKLVAESKPVLFNECLKRGISIFIQLWLIWLILGLSACLNDFAIKVNTWKPCMVL